MNKEINQHVLPAKTMATLAIIISIVVFMSFSFKNEPAGSDGKHENNGKDSIESVKAFMEVYKVLMSPRCMNCHPSGEVPLQGDDSHLHAMLPRRGKDGKGMYAMKCSSCHQAENVAGLHMPPGNPNWHLPPANMKMVFQGRTPRQLAMQLIDPKTNGNKNLQQLIEHADDGLVKAGWNPGEGLSLPPLSHEAFKNVWLKWINTGAYAPPAK